MHRFDRSARGAYAAGLLAVAATGLLAACSRPTAAPVSTEFPPGPLYTDSAPPASGGGAYPPPMAPTTMPPEGYPAPSETITGTATISPTVATP
jgi:hypothetical protein